MSHYEIGEWADYVRGLVQAERANEMSEHLLACDGCRDDRDLLASVALRMQSDLQYEVPEFAVRYARALFAVNATPRKTLLQKITGHLVFDTLQDAALAGARSCGSSMRHALYEAGDYSVDLRLEEEKPSGRMSMIGQLALRSQTPNSLSGLPILLMSGREVLAQAISNEFGEFQMDYEPKQRLKLQVPIEQQRERIELQLGSLVPRTQKKARRRQGTW